MAETSDTALTQTWQFPESQDNLEQASVSSNTLLFYDGIIVLCVAGKEMQNARPDMYSEMLKKLCLPLLKLGCDPDQVVHNLYHLLVLQLARWYSSAFMLRSKHTAIFIDTLMVMVKLS